MNAIKRAKEILKDERFISKAKYSSQNREHLLVFDGSIVSERFGPIWFGNLDITLDEPKLIQLGSEIGKIYVFKEGLKDDEAIYETDGFISEINPKLLRLYARNSDGKIKRRKQFYKQYPKNV